MLNELSEVSVSMNEEVNKLQTQACYWSRGEKRTLRKWMSPFTLAQSLLHVVT